MNDDFDEPQQNVDSSQLTTAQSLALKRKWQQAFDRWIMSKGAMPGPHPEKDHMWNVDRMGFMKSFEDDDDDLEY